MANSFANDHVMEVPFTDHKLECPACHQSLSVTVEVKVKPGRVQTVGGDHFRTNLSVSVELEQQMLRIEHHCVIPEKGD